MSICIDPIDSIVAEIMEEMREADRMFMTRSEKEDGSLDDQEERDRLYPFVRDEGVSIEEGEMLEADPFQDLYEKLLEKVVAENPNATIEELKEIIYQELEKNKEKFDTIFEDDSDNDAF